MFLDGDYGIFEVTPHRGVNDASFLIRVKDPSRLDYEEVNGNLFLNINFFLYTFLN